MFPFGDCIYTVFFLFNVLGRFFGISSLIIIFSSSVVNLQYRLRRERNAGRPAARCEVGTGMLLIWKTSGAMVCACWCAACVTLYKGLIVYIEQQSLEHEWFSSISTWPDFFLQSSLCFLDDVIVLQL